MDCREFRDRHALLVDVRCSALEEDEMRAHMRDCPPCAHHDAIIRRSLMLVRSLPTIEPSPQFRARLSEGLRRAALEPVDATVPQRPRLGSVAAMAAAAVVLAFLANSVVGRPGAPIVMSPVVATAPEHDDPRDYDDAPMATQALVATVPTGMSVWPAIMAASQVPIHYVAAEMATEH